MHATRHCNAGHARWNVTADASELAASRLTWASGNVQKQSGGQQKGVQSSEKKGKKNAARILTFQGATSLLIGLTIRRRPQSRFKNRSSIIGRHRTHSAGWHFRFINRDSDPTRRPPGVDALIGRGKKRWMTPVGQKDPRTGKRTGQPLKEGGGVGRGSDSVFVKNGVRQVDYRERGGLAEEKDSVGSVCPREDVVWTIRTQGARWDFSNDDY